METKNRNLIVSAVAFFLGEVFILSDNSGITANVVGYSNSEQAITAIIGLAILIGSAVLFVFTLNHSHSINKDRTDLERIARQSMNNHEDLTKQHREKQAMDEKYDQPYHSEEVKPEHK